MDMKHLRSCLQPYHANLRFPARNKLAVESVWSACLNLATSWVYPVAEFKELAEEENGATLKEGSGPKWDGVNRAEGAWASSDVAGPSSFDLTCSG